MDELVRPDKLASYRRCCSCPSLLPQKRTRVRTRHLQWSFLEPRLLSQLLNKMMTCVCVCVFFSLQSLCLTHTGKPTGVAVSHCITWFQTQLILTTCQIRYHSHLWDHRSTAQGGVPCAVRALCEKLAVLHHREFGKFRRLKGRH